eukprot:TRINITY_DN3121_c0_g1_i1.p1 TRINITY_DN3121_c0_g1~~TRINITY_DN3121_c0_g1_i1.p1  ORF type:complete len:239 (+),score=77.82 TRINITY_DN3121_c0_g1_i1:55-771(+)
MAENKCPVPHDKQQQHPLYNNNPLNAPPSASSSSKPLSGCPVSHGQGTDITQLNQMPKANQLPHPDQKAPLPTQRIASSIPTAHGKEGDTWVYPSEQMFFNAIKKKGWQNPEEKDMGSVVAIHNTVNEQCWLKVMQWEKDYSSECPNPRLKKFQGKAQDLSPKAKIMTLMGYTAPFDRHDWIVDRCGKDVRYIIDFYEGKRTPGKSASIYLDVRPAMDAPAAVIDRAKHYIKRDNPSS